jgi:predicted ATPase
LDQVGLVALADLCRLVDGVPLALERAGRAWLTESPVNCLALARRDPYSLLARGEPNGPKFHARMSAHLADLPCNALFQELAQLRDGWTIGEAAGVTRIPHGDLLSAVVIMLSRGMLLRNDSRVSTRFSMLNLVRSIIVSPST